jgi:AraC-like DNA-binding protein
MEFLVEYARQVQSLSVEEMKIGEMKGPYEKNMAVLEHYIDQHFGAPIGMEELCSLIHVTPQHLCRIFKQCSGMRPMEYIRHRRIEVAKALLEGTDTPISEIAAICGFENNNYFWKSFRQIVKMTPKEYRESTSRECR